MTSILEKVVYKTEFNTKQVWGMILMIALAVCVSLSTLVEPANDSAPTNVPTDFITPAIFPAPPIYTGNIPQSKKHITDQSVVKEEITPVWMAVVASLLMPSICTIFVVPLKYVNETLRIDPLDFTAGFWLLSSTVC